METAAAGEVNRFRPATRFAAGVLRLVQRAIGALEQAFARAAVVADRWRRPSEQVTLSLPSSVSNVVHSSSWRTRSARLRRAVRVGLLAQQAELFAAEARHDVGLALEPREDRAELFDHDVAGRMPVGVVDDLEVIDVGDDQATACDRSVRPR